MLFFTELLFSSAKYNPRQIVKKRSHAKLNPREKSRIPQQIKSTRKLLHLIYSMLTSYNIINTFCVSHILLSFDLPKSSLNNLEKYEKLIYRLYFTRKKSATNTNQSSV